MALATDTQAAAVQETSDGTLVGRNTTSKIGFYGTVPIIRPSVPLTTPTVQNVIDALKALGIVVQV